MHDDSPQPMATYRLQFNREFHLNDARALVAYFSRLGITHVYASPVLRARQASMHGYDVVDPKTLNPNLGDETDLGDLVDDLRKFGLGLVLDIVPNHMAASIENPYWRDVLTYGHSSLFAGWFDIDWRMPDPHMWGRVLVPVLGEPRARVLEQDQIEVVWSDGRFLVQYFEHVFPVDPGTVPFVCEFGLDDLRQRLAEGHPALDRIAEVLAYLKRLPKLAARLRRRAHVDRDETEHWLAQFAQIIVQSPQIQQWAEETAARFGQGEEGRRRLRKLLDSQPYRLVHWRDAARTINYRRFFDINELISVRQEDPHVFEETHAAVLRWVEDGWIDGLRIDHIDGLRDPLGYLERLVEACSRGERGRGTVPIFVEKILAPDEKLACGWPVTGTTGYEFLNEVEAIFVSPAGFAQILETYRRLLRRPVEFETFAISGKRRVLRNDLSPQVGRLADTLQRLAESRQTSPGNGPVEPPGLSALTAGNGPPASGAGNGETTLVSPVEPTKRDYVEALVEVVAALPVYRTYVDSTHCAVSDADRRYLETALQHAREAGRAAPEAIEFLGEVLLLENKAQLSEHEIDERVNFIQRFQQLTGPAAAKGIEDTALYAYVPLVSLNEVGGEPELPDDPLAVLHHANEERAATWPQTMLGVTTHDTKRTADVRARLDVLSELPRLWSGLVRRWQPLNQPRRSRVGGRHVPDAAAEYLFYQNLVGIWPAPCPQEPHRLPAPETLAGLCERLEQYMLKAVREAKVHTSWTNNNRPYEDAVLAFVRGLLVDDSHETTSFLADVQHLVARIARPGFWNSLSRTLLQLTSPGTPDLYQGDELWNFALVDPDNRRPVDYEVRQALLDEVITASESPAEARRAFVRRLAESPEDGRIKLHLIHSALAARRDHPRLFAGGRYLPLETDGPKRDHLVAFARVDCPVGEPPGASSQDAAAIVIAPRLTTGLTIDPLDAPLGEAAWGETVVQLPDQWKHRNWICALTREPICVPATGALKVAEALSLLPAALLINDRRDPS